MGKETRHRVTFELTPEDKKRLDWAHYASKRYKKDILAEALRQWCARLEDAHRPRRPKCVRGETARLHCLIPSTTKRALEAAIVERKRLGLDMTTQREIVEEALWEWLEKRGYATRV